MAQYDHVKEEAIRIIDEFATAHEVEDRYRKPAQPSYSADTKLPAIGINVWVRRAMPKRVSARMHERFRHEWRGVGASELEPVETIGAFIELMCVCTRTRIDDLSEPT